MNSSATAKTGKRKYLTRNWPSLGPYVEESDNFVFRLDNILRGKEPDRVESRLFRDPAVRLMLAVLEDAVNCFIKYIGAKSRRGQRMFREARDWFFNKDEDWLFSFENICDTVGINPGYLRSGLLRSASLEQTQSATDSSFVVAGRTPGVRRFTSAAKNSRASSIHRGTRPRGNRMNGLEAKPGAAPV